MGTNLAIASLTMLGWLGTAISPVAGADHHTGTPVPCVDLMQLALPETVVTSTVVVPAQGSNPAYCQVFATVSPETDIEVRLPDSWQRRFLHVGSGGLGGVIPSLDPFGNRLRQGYALAASNGGHRDPTGGPTRFLGNPALIEDYAHGAIGKTVRVSKAVMLAYYGRQPRYSYFSGCSAGGRGALNAAALFTDEYDGVVAGAAPPNMAGVVSGWALAAQQEAPSPAKLASMYQAELVKCDAQDGLADGVIGNPAACHFDPATLRCPDGVDTDSCLTEAEIQAVNTIRRDLTLKSGKTVYSRLGLGDPGTGFGAFMPLGPPGSPTVASFFSAAFLGYIVYDDPTYDPTGYDVDRDWPTVVNVMERRYDFSANTAPLARYLRSGRKMLVWHGADDGLVSHVDTIRAYDRMAEAAGHHARNARLYTPAGVQHCGGGPGADTFDLLDALTDWVEEGRAPRNLTASKVDAAGNVLFTRPLCEYSRYARYIGHGDPSDAASFRCVQPK
jgi:feruloyl esterase